MLTTAGVGAIFIFDLAPKPYYPTPMGAFMGTPQSLVEGYKLTFSVVSPDTKFIDCRVMLSINGAEQANQTINLVGGNAFMANTISWTDQSDHGKINAGDSLIISDPISSFTYRVTILYSKSGGQICSQSWTVP